MSSASYDLVLSSTIWHLSIPCVANLREVRVQAETASTVGESIGPGLDPEMGPHQGETYGQRWVDGDGPLLMNARSAV